MSKNDGASSPLGRNMYPGYISEANSVRLASNRYLTISAAFTSLFCLLNQRIRSPSMVM